MEPDEGINSINNFHQIISDIDENIDRIQKIDNDSLPSALLEYNNNLIKLRQLLLIGKINDIFNEDAELKLKFKIINEISSDLLNNHNIIAQCDTDIFIKQAHNDSIKLSGVIIFLTFITLWTNLFKSTRFYWWIYEVRNDIWLVFILVTILIVSFYYFYNRNSYRITNNFDIGLHPQA